jgi:hypothetical protein
MVFQGKAPERLMTRERQPAEWVELVRAEFVESPGLSGLMVGHGMRCVAESAGRSTNGALEEAGATPFCRRRS